MQVQQYSDAVYAADLVREAQVHLRLSDAELAYALMRRLGRTYTADQIERWKLGQTDPSGRALVAMRDMARCRLQTIEQRRAQQIANARVREIFASRKELLRLARELRRKIPTAAPALLGLAIAGLWRGQAVAAALWRWLPNGAVATSGSAAAIGAAVIMATASAPQISSVGRQALTLPSTPAVHQATLNRLPAAPTIPNGVARPASPPAPAASPTPSPSPSASATAQTSTSGVSVTATVAAVIPTPTPSPTPTASPTPLPVVSPTPGLVCSTLTVLERLRLGLLPNCRG